MMGIYCFTNKINNKKYIGQSRDLETRKKSHLRNYDNPNAVLTDEIVTQLRETFVNKSLSDLKKEYNVPFSTLKKAVYGVSFQHLPVYKKREKKWFLNGTCIDYPRIEE